MLDMMAPSTAADALLRAARLCLNERRAQYDAMLEHLTQRTGRSTAFAALEVAVPAGQEARLDDGAERRGIQARVEALIQGLCREPAASLQ